MKLAEFLSRREPFVVLDLEMTAWPGSSAARWSRPGEYREIVQIGAVRVGGDLSELDTFASYVRPVRNPILSDYFVSLTGITQRTIETEGVGFAEAAQAFARFVGGVNVVSNGPDGDIFIENCVLNGLECPIQPSQFIDVRSDVAAALSVSFAEADSNLLAGLVGAKGEGQAHDALSDCRSIATALRAIAARQ